MQKTKWKEVGTTLWRKIRWGFFSRRHSHPGEKLEGSDASNMISGNDLPKRLSKIAFTWGTGFPVVKKNTPYWIVIKTEDLQASDKFVARKLTPRESGPVSNVKVELSKTGNPPDGICVEIWTDEKEH